MNAMFKCMLFLPPPHILLGRLNWWTSAGRLPRLDPMATSGDGNCLLHAASLYMWGLHDHSLILRTALHRLLTTGVEKEGVKRRWKYQTQLRNDEAGGLTFTDEEWEFEWGEILRIATNKPRREPTTDSLRRLSSLRTSYESLEEIHISALAHTLRRPVIIISDRTIKDLRGEDLAPIYFGGIYLPLEVNPTACHKSPVVLAYDSSHFSPLVTFQLASSEQSTNQKSSRSKYARLSSRVETVIPLVTPDGSLLPVQFVHDPKKRDALKKWSAMQYKVGEFPEDIVRLLESYLNVRWIQLKMPPADTAAAATAASSTEDYDHLFSIQVPKVRFPAASIVQEAQPIYQKELVERYLKHVRVKYEEEKEAKARRQAQWEESERQRLLNVIVPCEGEGCEMFGRPATNNMCSVCYCKMMGDTEEGEGDGEGCVAVESPVDVPDVADCRTAELPPPPYARESHDLRPSSKEPAVGPPMGQQEEPNHLPQHQAPDHHNKSTAHHPPPPPPKAKQPLAPLQLNEGSKTSPLPSHTATGSHTPDGDKIASRSRSPSPKPHPCSKSPTLRPSAAVPKKAATPTSSSKGATPFPAQNAGAAKSSPRWVPNVFKKTPSSQSGSRYSRDNIQPLHLESDDTQGLNKAGIATSEVEGVTAIGMKKVLDCEL